MFVVCHAVFDGQGNRNAHMGAHTTFYSASVISVRKPLVWRGGETGGGLLMSAHTEIMCSYDHDQGTDGQLYGGCPDLTHEERWEQFLQVLRAGEPQTAYWINEIIVGRDDWETNLPGVVEAYVITSGDGEAIRRAHKRFLQSYQLCAADVPLLRYSPTWDQPRDGDAFADVSPPPDAEQGCQAWRQDPCIADRSEVPGWYATCSAIDQAVRCARHFAWSSRGEAVACSWTPSSPTEPAQCRMNASACADSPLT